MANNEFSLKPTVNLDIDKSKDIKSLKSIITDINKIGKNATINIIQNQDISDKEKYLSLWEENNKLYGIINSLNNKLSELERTKEIYQTFIINNYSNKSAFLLFLNELNESNIKYKKEIEIKTKPSQKNVIYGNSFSYEYFYQVLDKDVNEFLKIAKKNKIKIS